MTLPVRRSGSQPEAWRPLRELDELHAQMDRLVQSALDGWRWADDHAWMPAADVTETKDSYVVEVELPGVRREDVDVELSGDELVISGEFKERKRQGLLRRRTRRVGKFEYRVTVPGEIRDSDVSAALSHGVLTVELPKARSATARKITVTESGTGSS
ncbi:Hsp20/alpha crystallin family protein [Mycobacterium sp.]|uniref:Hsp20/alpha crystallin family protein n=1 Tax=Mycobacterium sp. TaxID=1785 RepID=UPI001275DB9F|nr:Hsp20/alpha crystallin family protein [Mycobacterium sp.]KAA8964336.1 MAG: Hsp20/alpha crystallin family protein [Mycobacterium sp.]